MGGAGKCDRFARLQIGRACVPRYGGLALYGEDPGMVAAIALVDKPTTGPHADIKQRQRDIWCRGTRDTVAFAKNEPRIGAVARKFWISVAAR